MKKVLALALALIMALSMGTMAFAADANADMICDDCSVVYGSVEAAKKCDCTATTTTTKAAVTTTKAEKTELADALLEGLTIKGILDLIVDIAKASMSQWDAIETVVNKILDLINGMGNALVSEADVNGAVEDLEASLATIKEGEAKSKLANLINGLKAKIKALYAGEKATDVTEVETPADTGSASVGIAVFAAVSVAAAAAYVCTKKKD